MKFKNLLLTTAFLFAFSVIATPASAASSNGKCGDDLGSIVSNANCVDYGNMIFSSKKQQMRYDRKAALRAIKVSRVSSRNTVKLLFVDTTNSKADLACITEMVDSVKEGMSKEDGAYSGFYLFGATLGYSAIQGGKQEMAKLLKEQVRLKNKGSAALKRAGSKRSHLFARALKAQSLQLKFALSSISKTDTSATMCDLKTALDEGDGYSSSAQFEKIVKETFPYLNDDSFDNVSRVYKKSEKTIKRAQKAMRKIKPRINRSKIEDFGNFIYQLS